jgi:3-deoxy-D-manno-octulosonate 8-phosphate phosphatase (KDO 8-P phosphatase)
VLTDGKIVYHDDGQQTLMFNVRDGLGLRLLMEIGIQVGVISGRGSAALDHRCRNLGITMVYRSVRNKVEVLHAILAQTGIELAETAFMGDDIVDIPPMQQVGCAIAVADAHAMVKTCAHVITHQRGGHGAVREIAEALIQAQDKWSELLQRLGLEPINARPDS